MSNTSTSSQTSSSGESGDKEPKSRVFHLVAFGILLALPAAAVLSVLVRFAFDRYLKEHPEALVVLDEE